MERGRYALGVCFWFGLDKAFAGHDDVQLIGRVGSRLTCRRQEILPSLLCLLVVESFTQLGLADHPALRLPGIHVWLVPTD